MEEKKDIITVSLKYEMRKGVFKKVINSAEKIFSERKDSVDIITNKLINFLLSNAKLNKSLFSIYDENESEGEESNDENDNLNDEKTILTFEYKNEKDDIYDNIFNYLFKKIKTTEPDFKNGKTKISKSINFFSEYNNSINTINRIDEYNNDVDGDKTVFTLIIHDFDDNYEEHDLGDGAIFRINYTEYIISILKFHSEEKIDCYVFSAYHYNEYGDIDNNVGNLNDDDNMRNHVIELGKSIFEIIKKLK